MKLTNYCICMECVRQLTDNGLLVAANCQSDLQLKMGTVTPLQVLTTLQNTNTRRPSLLPACPVLPSVCSQQSPVARVGIISTLHAVRFAPHRNWM